MNLVDPSGLSAWGWFQFVARTALVWQDPTNYHGLLAAVAVGATFDGVDDDGVASFTGRTVGLKYSVADITIGHVIIYARSAPAALQQYHDHETAHTRQHDALGPLYLPAHGASMGISWLRSDSRSKANWLECGPNQTPSRPWPW